MNDLEFATSCTLANSHAKAITVSLVEDIYRSPLHPTKPNMGWHVDTCLQQLRLPIRTRARVS
jgi:hypothetical protein